MYENIKKEIYEKRGKKMGQENPWKARVKLPKGDNAEAPGKKFGDGSDFKKGAIQRRIAKMNTKGKTVEAKDAK